MENQKPAYFFFIIIVLILGKALYNQFDFETLKFEKPALASLYLIVFSVSIYFIIKNLTTQLKK